MRTLVPVRIAGTNDCHVSAGHLVPATGTGRPVTGTDVPFSSSASNAIPSTIQARKAPT